MLRLFRGTKAATKAKRQQAVQCKPNLEVLEQRDLLATVIELGDFDPVGINASGQVLGNSYHDPIYGPVIYSDGNLSALDIPTSSGQPLVTGFNDSGQVIGANFVYSPGTGLSVLERWHWWMSTSAINNSGQVVGSADVPYYPYDTHAFVYTPATGMVDLGTLGDDRSEATGINNFGQVVGMSRVSPSGESHPFVYSPAGGMSDLGIPVGYHNFQVTGINDFGQVVGYAYTYTGVPHWEAFLYTDGGWTGLSTLPGDTNSLGLAINNFGQVVGYSVHFSSSGDYDPECECYPSESFGRAFLWQDGAMRDLNDLIPPSSGWTLEQAIDINDAGQILGVGYHDGTRTPFLFVPDSFTDIAPTSLTWDTTQGGVNFEYKVTGTPLPQDTPIRFYWATNSDPSSLFEPINTATVTVPVGTVPGNYTIHLTSDLFPDEPDNARDVVAITDPDNTLGTFDPKTNVLVTPWRVLPVTPYYQFGDSWGGDTYGFGPHTVAQKGCAMTALSMSLTYAGAAFDPGTLNSLLTAAGPGEGYDSASGVQWSQAVDTASAVARKFLEWEPLSDSGDLGAVQDTLQHVVVDLGEPVIVGVKLGFYSTDNNGNGIYAPGHYVLVTGKVGDRFTIADPGYENIFSLDAYGNHNPYNPELPGFLLRGYVIDPPIRSRLVVSAVAVPPGVQLSVVDSQGNITGIDPATGEKVEQISGSVYFIDALQDDVTGEAPTAISQLVDVVAPQPGIYTIKVTGTTADPAPFTLLVSGWTQDGINQNPLVIQGSASVRPTTFTITVKADQAITFAPLPDKTYGDPSFTIAATASSGLPVSFSIVSGPATVSGNMVTITGAGTVVVQASQDGDDNYNSAPTVQQSFVVQKGKPTLAVTGGTYTYDGKTHPATGSVKGINAENLGSLSFTYSGLSTVPVNAGTYTVVASFPGDDNYNAASDESASVVIKKATPKVTATGGTFTYDGAWHTASGSITGVGGISLGPPTFTYTDGEGHPVAAPINAGTYTVLASFLGNDNYDESSAIATITINKAPTSLSNLLAPTIVYGTASTTLSGKVTSGSLTLSGSVSITLNGVTQTVEVQADGTFSATFATDKLAPGSHSIDYSYLGAPNFLAASEQRSQLVTSTAYTGTALFDQAKPAKSGSTIPIKLQLTDADGRNVSTPDLDVTAMGIAPVSNPSPVLPVKSRGNANPNSRFRLENGLGGARGYIFNLDTTGLAPGTYFFYYRVGDDPTTHAVQFVVR